MSRWTTVLVGFGRVAAGYAADVAMARHYTHATHAQVLRAHPRYDWDAVVDTSMPALRAAQELWGVSHCATMPTELGDPERYDVAVLAVPPGAREKVVAGLPGLRGVIVEKPLGRTVAEAEAFAAFCRSRHITVAVCMPRRVDADLRALAAGGLSARVGRVQSVIGCYGNGLINNGTHLVDVLRLLFGEMKSVVAFPDQVVDGSPLDGDRSPAFRLATHAGVGINVHPLDFCYYREVAIDVWGERGRLALVQEGLRAVFHATGPHRALTGATELLSDAGCSTSTSLGTSLDAIYDDLDVALRDGHEPISSAAESIATLRVLATIERSLAEGGRTIEVPGVTA